MQDQMQIRLRNAQGGSNEVRRVGVQLVVGLLKYVELPDIERLSRDDGSVQELAEAVKGLLRKNPAASAT